jgi:hypothetical protein
MKGQKGRHNSSESEFKKDMTPWNKGKTGYKNPNYPKDRKKVGTRKKGWKHTEDAKTRMGQNRKGEKNGSWKGGITPETIRMRHSKEYRIWREAVFERDNWTCIWCFKKGVELNADHIKQWAYYPELRFAIDNGRTLCVSCHRTTYPGRSKLKINKD